MYFAIDPRNVLGLVASAIFVACSSPGTEMRPGDTGGEQRSCPIGDRSLSPEAAIVFHRPDGDLMTATSSVTEIPLLPGEQGGHLLIIGARARNVDGCNLRLTVSVRDECSGKIIGLESRPVVLDTSADGWGAPAFVSHWTNFANVAMCPNSAAERDVNGYRYEVRARIEDGEDRQAVASTIVAPVCRGDTEVLCNCECRAGSVLGGACPAPPADAGDTTSRVCPSDGGSGGD